MRILYTHIAADSGILP